MSADKEDPSNAAPTEQARQKDPTENMEVSALPPTTQAPQTKETTALQKTTEERLAELETLVPKLPEMMMQALAPKFQDFKTAIENVMKYVDARVPSPASQEIPPQAVNVTNGQRQDGIEGMINDPFLSKIIGLLGGVFNKPASDSGAIVLRIDDVMQKRINQVVSKNFYRTMDQLFPEFDPLPVGRTALEAARVVHK